MWRGEGNSARLSVGWYARSNIQKRGKISRKDVGPFSKETQAAAYLAKAKGIPVSALRIRAPVAAADACTGRQSVRRDPAARVSAKTQRVSMYKYVAYHKQKGGWVVQVSELLRQRSRKGKHAKVVNCCGGPFPDQLTAAQQAAALSGICLSELRLNKKRSPKELRRRQAVIMRVYKMQSAQTLEGPGDLEATVEHAHKSRRMFREMPALELVSILGKYKPWKDSLLTSYHHVRKQGLGSQVRGNGVERSARLLWRVCMMALRSNANCVDKFAPWIEHVGRNMARCSGSYYQVHTPSRSSNLLLLTTKSFSTPVLGVQ